MICSSLLERTPVLSLTPDSISQLGNLDSSSLFELWGVFTKCKDSLKDGRRLENLTFRIWFESIRKSKLAFENGVGENTIENNLNQKQQAVSIVHHQQQQSNSEADWSDPEWSEESDSGGEEVEDVAEPSGIIRSNNTNKLITNTSPDRSNFESSDLTLATNITTTTTSRPSTTRVNSGGLRTNCPLTGGSLERMIIGLTTLPAITSYAHNSTIIDSNTITHSNTTSTTTPRSMNVNFNTPPPLIAVPEVIKVDGHTQTTPSTSHRPSPSMKSPIPLRRLSNQFPPPQLTKSSISTSVKSINKPNLARRATGIEITNSYNNQNNNSSNIGIAFAKSGSEVQLKRNESFEPRSYVKGFDTTVFDSRPFSGSIAPPPTPAAGTSLALSPAPQLLESHRSNSATPPPSAMKSSNSIGTNNKKLPNAISSNKKIFFISSHSDSEEDSSSISVGSGGIRGSSNNSNKRSTSGSYRVGSIPIEKNPPPISPKTNSNAIASTSKLPPPTTTSSSSSNKNKPSNNTTTIQPNSTSADEWDDEDSSATDEDEDDDASSGWGSEYSTESETQTKKALPSPPPAKPKSLFAKRPSIPIASGSNTSNSELKPRPPGLLSQLFHPDLISSGLLTADRTRSEIDMRKRGEGGLQSSRSTGVLTEQLRNKSFLRGAPAGTEMDSSSDEDESQVVNGVVQGEGGSDGFEDEDSETSNTTKLNSNNQSKAVSNALYRQQQSQILLEQQQTTSTVPIIAPPQTPRTTRRAMLATELSESLRRNLLWERQTRNRIVGGAVSARFLPVAEEVVPPSAQASNSNNTNTTKTSTTNSNKTSTKSSKVVKPPPVLRRRNTTGTGLYLEGQMKALARDHGKKSSEDEEDEDLSEDSEVEVLNSGKLSSSRVGLEAGSGFPSLHSHGW